MSFRIVITTTLNNNLFRAKLVPLLQSRDDIEVVVVTDRAGPSLPGVKWIWPRGLMSTLGRLGGRLPLLMREIMHPRTRLVMAYSVTPHGIFATGIGHFFRKPVYLHFIGGPAEIHFAHDKTVADNRMILASKDPGRLERIARRTGRKAERVFVPGSRTEQFLHQQGYDSRRVIQLHSAVDFDLFHPGENTRDFDVLVSAQLRARKRPIFTLQVLREILNRRPESRFCWLGDGAMRPEFERALDEYGLRQHMTWTETDNVADYYRRGRVFLLCSVSEGLSLACMEAMACGMVPVTADCGDMGDIVRNGQTGVLLPVNAPVTAYADAVVKLLGENSQWTRYSEASIDLIRREHSFAAASAAWKRILDELVRPKRKSIPDRTAVVE